MEKINNTNIVFQKTITVLIVLFSIFVVVVYISSKHEIVQTNFSPDIFAKGMVNLDGKNLSVLIADNKISIAQGLAGVTKLSDHEGMLIKFENSSNYSIWMKNMIIPIDILWIGEKGKVLWIEEKVRPETYPKTFYPKNIKAKYVLELASGYVERNNVKKGDLMTFPLSKK